MRNRTFHLSLFIYSFVLAIITLVSCESDLPEGEWSKTPTTYHFSIDKQKIEAKSVAVSELLSVKTNGNWSASANDSWISLNSSSGKGDSQISVNIAENGTTSDRMGMIAVRSLTLDSIIYVSVTQLGKSLHVDQDALTFGNAGETKTVSISAEGNLSISTSESWLSAKVNGNELNVSVEPNVSSEDRKASVLIEITGLSSGSLSQEISVLQTNKDYFFSIEKDSFSSSSAAFSDLIELSTNDEWTISSDKDWVAFAVSSGQGDASINVNVTENKTPEQRSAVVTITGKYSGKTASVTISQDGKFLTTDPSSLNFTTEGGRKTITVSTDGTFSVSKEGNWFSVSTEGNVITVSAETNSATTSRSGSITVTMADLTSGNLTRTIEISQGSKSYTLSLNKSSISIGADASSETFTISTNDSWTASSDVSWATLSATSGSGDKTITVTVSANSGNSARSGSITIRGNNSGTETISIFQQGKAITYSTAVSRTSVSVGNSSASETFTISSNESWTATSDVSWATLSATSGSGDKTITLSIGANSSNSARSGSIVIKGSTSGISKTITISQQGQVITYSTSVSKSEIAVAADGASESFSISSNEAWTATSDAAWATLSSTSGSGDKTITVSVSSNSTTSARSAMITVKGTTSEITKTISVSQVGKAVTYSTSVNKSEISAAADGANESFTISSNEAWTATSDAAWATLSATSGSGDKTISVTVNTNSTTTARSAKITVKGTTSGITKTISVSQEGKAITYSTAVNKSEISAAADGASESFTISSNEVWTASSDADWVALSATSGSGDQTITVTISTNSTTSARSAKITVKGATSGTTKTISVSQEGKAIIYSTSVNKTEISTSADGASESFTISSNEDWTASSDAAWATLSATSGSGDKTITVTISTNSTTSVRDAKITIIGSASGETNVISITQEGKTIPGVDGYDNGHAYVDLGIKDPNGSPIYWATCNIGANIPEENGLYFAWGETDTNKSQHNFTWLSYRLCNGTGTSITKYCTKSMYGSVDNKTIIELENDAAHINWGGSWRMPTKEELEQLQKKCTWTWIAKNGVNGYEIKGPNGGSIFLPAAGCRIQGNTIRPNVDGNYWSSYLSAETPTHAGALDFTSNEIRTDVYNIRYEGMSIRAVCQ